MHWIDPSLSAEHPSPRINITAKGGLVEEVAGDEAGPSTVQTAAGSGSAPAPAVTKSSAGASKGLGVAAPILGALGLLIGLSALVVASRARRR